MKKLINKLKIPILAGAFVLFSSSDLPKNKAKDIKVIPGSGTEYLISRRKARKGINRLAKTAYSEDAWIYHDGKLIDVGTEADIDEAELDWDRIKLETSKAKKILYFHHNHPFKAWGEEIEPPSGSDILCDEDLKEIADSNNKQIISEVIDASGRWIYNSNLHLRTCKSIDKNKTKRSVHYSHKEAFPGKQRTKKDIEFFMEKMEDYGFKVKYKKIR